MRFLNKKNPAVYLSETTQYVNDLQRITLLRDKSSDPSEIANYDNLIHVMQEVLLFMNSISDKDRRRVPALQPLG
jgi:hypothetical protein